MEESTARNPVESEWNEQLILEGGVVRLEPLRPEHAANLWKVAESALADIFQYIPRRIRNEREFQKSIESALAECEHHLSIPFVIVIRSSGQEIGMTRFRMVEFEKHRVEIAATWIAPPWQKAKINTEAKYLMLRHAFEQWSCQRVNFRTDARNLASRKSLVGIGGKEEDGCYLETFDRRVWQIVHFRILANEWPLIRTHLEAQMRDRQNWIERI